MIIEAIQVNEKFDIFFRKMVNRTCKEWEYDITDEEYYSNVYKRLQYGLQNILSHGLSSGLIEDVGLSKTKSAGSVLGEC